MPDDERLNVAEMLCDVAKVARYGERLFCLGPNVGRINFLSQQIRALNLVWALHVRRLIEPNYKVAVIGGGIAGITAAVALRAYECTVRVFDEGASPMHRQRGAKHRHIFPNINWWPQAVDELAVTTALPFLDWHLDQCDRVIAVLEAEWARLERESGDDVRFIGPATINRAEPDDFDGGRITLKSVQNGSWDGFDTVILASGFGEERVHLDIPCQSYWKSDDLESNRDGKVPKLPVIVSGFGDGGQIDALRLAYRGFKDGMLTFRVSQYIETSDLRTRLAEAECKIEGKLDYPGLADLIDSDRAFSDLRVILEDALFGNERIVIMTDGNLPSPFESPAAPIHKLLVAYAHLKRRISIKSGEIKAAGGGGKRIYQIQGAPYHADYNHIVIRHGAKPPEIPLLINEDEWKELAVAQKRSANFSHKPAWAADNPPAVPDGWPCPVRSKENYIASRKHLARAAMHIIGSAGRVDPYVDRFIVSGHDQPFKPSRLFGMPVEYVGEGGLTPSPSMD